MEMVRIAPKTGPTQGDHPAEGIVEERGEHLFLDRPVGRRVPEKGADVDREGEQKVLDLLAVLAEVADVSRKVFRARGPDPDIHAAPEEFLLVGKQVEPGSFVDDPAEGGEALAAPLDVLAQRLDQGVLPLVK